MRFRTRLVRTIPKNEVLAHRKMRWLSNRTPRLGVLFPHMPCRLFRCILCLCIARCRWVVNGCIWFSLKAERFLIRRSRYGRRKVSFNRIWRALRTRLWSSSTLCSEPMLFLFSHSDNRIFGVEVKTLLICVLCVVKQERILIIS